MADEINPQLPIGLRPDRGGGFLTPAAKPDFAPTNPAPAGGEPGAFTGEVATLGGFEVQGAGAERFAPKYPEVSSGYGPTVESASQAGVEPVEPPVEYGDTRPARSSRMSSYDTASAERQARAGGAATFEGESAARQARAGGAATYAQESAARNERAVPSRTPGQIGPDSRDRDRTGRISKDEGRALERGLAGTSKSPYDAGKIQTVLARLGRTLGGQKEVDRQIDQAFGSGAAGRIGGDAGLGASAAAEKRITDSRQLEDYTSAADGPEFIRTESQSDIDSRINSYKDPGGLVGFVGDGREGVPLSSFKTLK